MGGAVLRVLLSPPIQWSRSPLDSDLRVCRHRGRTLLGQKMIRWFSKYLWETCHRSREGIRPRLTGTFPMGGRIRNVLPISPNEDRLFEE
jgi:hypothetical protein